MAQQSIKVAAFSPLPGEIVGMLVSHPGPVLDLEGRFGPADAFVLSKDHDSYRWIYFLAQGKERAQASSTAIRTLDQPEQTFDNVVLATRESLALRGIEGEYRLARVLVNGGRGSAADVDTIVATQVNIIDGTSDFAAISLKVADIIRGCAEGILESKSLGVALEKLKSGVRGGDRSWVPTSLVLPFVTWLSDAREVEVTCDRELSVEPRSVGTGIEPERSERQAEPLTTYYGLKLSARQRLRYLIDRSGNIQAAPGSGIETSVEDLPPPGAPARP